MNTKDEIEQADQPLLPTNLTIDIVKTLLNGTNNIQISNSDVKNGLEKCLIMLTFQGNGIPLRPQDKLTEGEYQQVNRLKTRLDILFPNVPERSSPTSNVMFDRRESKTEIKLLTSRQKMYRADFYLHLRCHQDNVEEDPCCFCLSQFPDYGTIPRFKESDWQGRVNKDNYDRLNRNLIIAYSAGNDDGCLDCWPSYQYSRVERELSDFNRIHERVNVRLKFEVAATRNKIPVRHRIYVRIWPIEVAL